MRLKQIKLAGFKSFVDSTKIPFLHPLSAIVGPNGCGKSNTIDAVRWVLGESSAKNLRGDAMTDVIFNGSTVRRPVSVASVELVFENLDGRLGGQYASYQEIAIKRQVTRDSENSYFLNGVKCRRKDITDVFMGTGLGPRSYAIIEQGTISRLIESKPQDLRVFIEEAAGISRYKERRKDTENRIRHTRDNLLRLNDIRLELGQQLEKLELQASSAKKYRDYKNQERKTHAELLVMRYQNLLLKADQLSKDIAGEELTLAKLLAEKEKGASELVQHRLKLQSLEAKEQTQVQSYYQTATEMVKYEQQLKNAQQKDETSQQAKAKILAQLTEYKDRQQQFNSKRDGLKLSISQLAPELDMTNEMLDELKFQLEDMASSIETQTAGLELCRKSISDIDIELALTNNKSEFNALSLKQKKTQLIEIEAQLANIDSDSQLNEIRLKISKIEQSKQQKQTQSQQLTDNHTQLTHQIQQLKKQQQELLANKASVSARVELIEQWLETATTKGKQVWQYLDVKPGWEAACELLFSTILATSVIETPKDAGEFDKTNCLGFHHLTDHYVDQHINAEINLSPWLQGVQFVESKAQAETMLETLADNERIVTADGYLLGHGFVLKQTTSESSVLVLQQEQAELKLRLQLIIESGDLISAKLNQLSVELDEVKAKKQLAQTELTDLTIALTTCIQQQKNLEHRQSEQAELKYNLLQHQQGLTSEVEKLGEVASELDNKLLDIQHNKAKLNEALVAKQTQFQSIKSEYQNIKLQLTQTEDKQRQKFKKYSDLTTELALCKQELTQINERITELNNAIQALKEKDRIDNDEINLLSLKNKLSSLVELQQQQQQQLDSVRQQQGELKADLDTWSLQQKQQVGTIEKQVKNIASLKLRREGLKGQTDSQLELMNESKVSIQPVLELLPADAKPELWQKKLESLRLKISQLGAINLAAIDEYEQQHERKSYLDSQYDDLNSALQSLEQAILKIDKETRSRFKTTFEQINDDFAKLFPKVFGGGKAYLALTGDDLLETGVSIMAQPPGKKNSTIHLLSGGEKALTALSLVFAIFRLNPAPFCMLDEVDAPLDDANVERFCRLLKEMSQTVQFIYISHNKITMEMADQLIGVTMHEPGVSRIVAVDLEEAVAMADAV